MSKLRRILILITLSVPVLCICCGCTKSVTTHLNDDVGTKPTPSEPRLAGLLYNELKQARVTYTLPNTATLEIDSTELSEAAVRAELAQKLKSLKVTLVENAGESHLSIKVDKVTVSVTEVSAHVLVKWGPRKGYRVEIKDVGGKFQRDLTARL